ncbi:hypothetical protein [Bacillus sp. UNC41MFS5]|uniref:hypothetical protein n=1 Tax=Bacillus sp. UNC41MFS5 TaxID=1449046 RepID=UPI0012DE8299|nr:hypothetical protein [Bacillus sp. UNC41MFS5]
MLREISELNKKLISVPSSSTASGKKVISLLMRITFMFATTLIFGFAYLKIQLMVMSFLDDNAHYSTIGRSFVGRSFFSIIDAN